MVCLWGRHLCCYLFVDQFTCFEEMDAVTVSGQWAVEFRKK